MFFSAFAKDSTWLFIFQIWIAWVSGLPKGLGERRFLASIFPLFPPKRLILRLNLEINNFLTKSFFLASIAYFAIAKLTHRCSTIFALGIVLQSAASSLGDLSSCNSVDITKNLSLITLAAWPVVRKKHQRNEREEILYQQRHQHELSP